MHSACVSASGGAALAHVSMHHGWLMTIYSLLHVIASHKQDDCFGTMAPDGPGSSMYECNMCGHKRTEAEFLDELERQEREEA